MRAVGLAARMVRERRTLKAYRDSVGARKSEIGHASGAGVAVSHAELTIAATGADAMFVRDVVR